jgi:UDP-galactopyranose mutase
MTPEREELIDSIVSHLKDGDVRLIGRYGQWDYISMEDCIRSAINVVEEILS